MNRKSLIVTINRLKFQISMIYCLILGCIFNDITVDCRGSLETNRIELSNVLSNLEDGIKILSEAINPRKPFYPPAHPQYFNESHGPCEPSGPFHQFPGQNPEYQNPHSYPPQRNCSPRYSPNNPNTLGPRYPLNNSNLHHPRYPPNNSNPDDSDSFSMNPNSYDNYEHENSPRNPDNRKSKNHLKNYNHDLRFCPGYLPDISFFDDNQSKIASIHLRDDCSLLSPSENLTPHCHGESAPFPTIESTTLTLNEKTTINDLIRQEEELNDPLINY